MLGQSLGGSAVIEVCVSVFALRDRVIAAHHIRSRYLA
jgi:hypothetical protein